MTYASDWIPTAGKPPAASVPGWFVLTDEIPAWTGTYPSATTFPSDILYPAAHTEKGRPS